MEPGLKFYFAGPDIRDTQIHLSRLRINAADLQRAVRGTCRILIIGELLDEYINNEKGQELHSFEIGF